MKVPLSWLEDYVDVNMPMDELAHRITMAGVEVGEVITIGGWSDCFVGYVARVEPHPNADRLTLCTVDVANEAGGQQMQVVCGAPNVAEGQKIAFARVGAQLFNTHSGKTEPLKAARIRGVVSEGMICSEVELGIGEDHTGILVLPEDAPVGMPLSDYMGDQVLDLEVTPNRPDCLSVLGIAHEVAALTGGGVHEPDISYREGSDPIEALASVEVADPDLCPRYTASLITGVKIGPSPQWLQDRLAKAGMRPINNVVDITNYVMLEYNQPLHAFDFHTLKEGKIIVRRARPGEALTSLDGVERRLGDSMLVIADAQDPVGLAGIIGGIHTEMTESTTTVLLESASFNPINNRRTAQALRLSTEATTRFEKGLRVELAPIALRRATKLITEIAGGVAARGILDIFPAGDEYAPPIVTLTMERLEKVLGISLPVHRAEQVLTSLGLPCDRQGEGAITVTVPYWRSDINIEDDLVEEVARIVGYDEIPTAMLSTPVPHHRPQPLQELKDRVKDLLVSCGMQEVINYPVSSLEDLDRVGGIGPGPMPLKLTNPMSSQQEYMRTTLRAGLLSTLAANQTHEQDPIRIFESGHIYLPRREDLPEEREVAAGMLTGPRWEAHWLADRGEMGFHDAKGVMENLMAGIGVRASYEPVEDPFLHPGRGARILAGPSGNITLGLLGEVHPNILEGSGIERVPVAVFELDIEGLLEAMPQEGPLYRPVSRFPSAIRDLSILVDRDVSAARVQEIVERQRLVTRIQLFDIYTGENIPPGKRSLAYHIYFQAQDRTLTAEEVNRAFQSVVNSLGREVGAELRG